MNKILVLLLLILAIACTDGQTDSSAQTDTVPIGETDTDADTDADSDADTDADSDADSDADTDADSDADTDADSDADSDADTDADSDADSDADTDSDTETDTDTDTVPNVPMGCGVADDYKDWLFIEGGSYEMGYIFDTDLELAKADPIHTVTIPDLCVWRTEVTVRQYLACVDAGACEMPEQTIQGCNIDKEDERLDYPANCVLWYHAQDFCDYVGGRLISESQWEYYARNRGQDVLYPWGGDDPSCDLAVIDIEGEDRGCDTGMAWPVCSKPLGNTEQGLCDMAGNVYEWTGDYFHDGYEWEDAEGTLYFAPDDGSYWKNPVPSANPFIVMRGGGVGSNKMYYNRMRIFHDDEFSYSGLGIRCVREPFVPQTDSDTDTDIDTDDSTNDTDD